MNKKFFIYHLVVCYLTLLSSLASAGNITNGNFETGDLSGWSADPSTNVSVITSGFAPYTADLWGGEADTETQLSQLIFLDEGDILAGQAKWIGYDSLPDYNDWGRVTINSTNLFYADIATFGDYGSSPVMTFSFRAPYTGMYTLIAAVANKLDNAFSSELQVSNFSVITYVTEPSTIAIFGIGMVSMVFGKRRKLID